MLRLHVSFQLMALRLFILCSPPDQVRKSGQTVAARLCRRGRPRERTGISHTPDTELFLRAALPLTPDAPWRFQPK